MALRGERYRDADSVSISLATQLHATQPAAVMEIGLSYIHLFIRRTVSRRRFLPSPADSVLSHRQPKDIPAAAQYYQSGHLTNINFRYVGLVRGVI